MCLGFHFKQGNPRFPPLTCTSESASAAASGNQCSFWWYLYSSSFFRDTLPTTCHRNKRTLNSEVVWTCLLFIRSGLARHTERGKKTRQTEKEVGRQHQGMDRSGVCQVLPDSGEKRRMEETGCEVTCGAPKTPTVMGQVKMKVSVSSIVLPQ